MATPGQIVQTIVDAVPDLSNLQRLRLRNQWTSAWDAYATSRGFGGDPDRHAKVGWYVHHECVRALREIDWPTLAERARARWDGNAEGYARADIWQTAARFVARDTIRAVLARDTDIDPTVYALLTAAWRSQFPGFDA